MLNIFTDALGLTDYAGTRKAREDADRNARKANSLAEEHLALLKESRELDKLRNFHAREIRDLEKRITRQHGKNRK